MENSIERIGFYLKDGKYVWLNVEDWWFEQAYHGNFKAIPENRREEFRLKINKWKEKNLHE